MLYYDRIDVSQDIDVNKTNLSKECIIRFQPTVCNGCQDIKSIAILNIHGVDYGCIISKTEAISLSKN